MKYFSINAIHRTFYWFTGVTNQRRMLGEREQVFRSFLSLMSSVNAKLINLVLDVSVDKNTARQLLSL